MRCTDRGLRECHRTSGGSCRAGALALAVAVAVVAVALAAEGSADSAVGEAEKTGAAPVTAAAPGCVTRA